MLDASLVPFKYSGYVILQPEALHLESLGEGCRHPLWHDAGRVGDLLLDLQ